MFHSGETFAYDCLERSEDATSITYATTSVQTVEENIEQSPTAEHHHVESSDIDGRDAKVTTISRSLYPPIPLSVYVYIHSALPTLRNMAIAYL